MRIALTGGIACGKSLFAKFLRELGVQTLDADDIVHELIPEVERRRLAPIVFADPAARRALESRIHPQVKARFDAWFASENCAAPTTNHQPPTTNHQPPTTNYQPPTTNDQQPITNDHRPTTRIAIIPLLFECHWDADYDIILCISSPAEVQIRRMMATRGMSREAAIARLKAQLPVPEKAARSHYVILNDSTVDHLREEAVRCVAWLNAIQEDGGPECPKKI